MPTTIDAALTRRWAASAVLALDEACSRIDAMNVFPVADADTGTNLLLTMRAGRGELETVPVDADLAAASAALARGALVGARGNSGVIISQLLQGWAEQMARLPDGAPAGADAVRQALRRADDQAWAAVARPQPGTMLTVSRAAAAGAEATTGDDVGVLLHAASDAARRALADTTGQLDALTRAGVVDAGGLGVVVLLDALLEAVTGVRPDPPTALSAPVAQVVRSDECLASTVTDGAGFEVMYLLDAPAGVIASLTGELDAVGDSVVVVGGPELWHVHVHTADAGAAVELGLGVGSVRQVRISTLPAVESDAVAPDAATFATATPSPMPGVGVAVVACVAGPGLVDLLTRAGAVAVPSGPGARTTGEELLERIEGSGAGTVVVLPNDRATHLLADQAASVARHRGVRVAVVPIRAQVQVLSALAVHDPEQTAPQQIDDLVARMSAAAGATRHGAVTVAVTDAFTSAGRCVPGDVLGVVDGDFVHIGTDLVDVAVAVLERLLSGGGELVTLISGVEADEDSVRRLGSWLRSTHRSVEVTVHRGGQLRYPLLIGVE